MNGKKPFLLEHAIYIQQQMSAFILKLFNFIPEFNFKWSVEETELKKWLVKHLDENEKLNFIR